MTRGRAPAGGWRRSRRPGAARRAARAVAAARLFVAVSAGDAARARLRRRRPFTPGGRCVGLDRPAPPARILATACCWPRRSASAGTLLGFLFALHASRGLGSPRWIAAARRGDLLPLVSPPFTTAIAIIFSFGPRGLITYDLLGIKASRSTAWSSTLAAESLTYFPIAYLTLRPMLAAIDSNIEDMALRSARRAGACSARSRCRSARRACQRLPAAVRGVARRFRDAADPRRQPVPGAADAGVPADHRPVRLPGRRGRCR